jgi:hypothetical protein
MWRDGDGVGWLDRFAGFLHPPARVIDEGGQVVERVGGGGQSAIRVVGIGGGFAIRAGFAGQQFANITVGGSVSERVGVLGDSGYLAGDNDLRDLDDRVDGVFHLSKESAPDGSKNHLEASGCKRVLSEIHGGTSWFE